MGILGFRVIPESDAAGHFLRFSLVWIRVPQGHKKSKGRDNKSSQKALGGLKSGNVYRALASPARRQDITRTGNIYTWLVKMPKFSERYKELLLSICYCYVRRLCRAILIQSYHNFCIHESLVYKYSKTRPIMDGFRKNNVNYWVFREIRSIIPHL